MLISAEEVAAAQLVARLMDSVDHGDREQNVEIVKACPPALFPIVVLTLAGVLHDAEQQLGVLAEAVVKLRQQLKSAIDESTAFAEGYNTQRAKVLELRSILDAHAARSPAQRGARVA